MIKLSNGYRFCFMAGAGALGFDGLGWPHPKYWILRHLLRKNPNSIVPVIKTLTLLAQKGNYRAIYDGDDYVVNAVKLKNSGFKTWHKKYFPNIERRNQDIILSITGGSVKEIELLSYLIIKLPKHIIKGVEFNSSCSNVEKEWMLEEIVKALSTLRRITEFPIGVKLGYHQDFLEIAKAVSNLAEWISFNSVPWEIVFPGEESPLMEKYDVSGAVSGKVIKEINKEMALEIRKAGIKTPIIASSIGWQENFDAAYKEVWGTLKPCGWAEAVSFGSLFRKHPVWPIKIAKKYNSL